MKLTGIIEDVFRGVTIFRGYATLKTLARLSASTSYQRDKDPDRIDAIKDYISNSSYVFYPELILGCIIRKTKRFSIPERAVYFLKTKRTAGGTPPPQNIFDRLTPVFT